MFYREIAPSDDLRHVILSFWEFAVPDAAPAIVEHEVFPDGCASLFYLRNSKRGLNVTGISGLQLNTVVRSVSAGDTYWGMRISPASCSILLRMDPSGMAGERNAALNSFPHLTDGLAEELSSSPNLEAAVPVLERRIRKLFDPLPNPDVAIAKAVEIIEETRGEVRVDELGNMLDLSTRQFQRRFKASSGLSPKQYIRTRRIRATAVVLVEDGNVNWADRAAEMGFSDQSHLTHEFVAVTKRSPTAFAENVKKIEHGDLVK